MTDSMMVLNHLDFIYPFLYRRARTQTTHQLAVPSWLPVKASIAFEAFEAAAAFMEL